MDAGGAEMNAPVALAPQVFRSVWERRLGKTESPIEAYFLEAFCPAAIEAGYEVANRSAAKQGVIHVIPQKPLDNRRVDFLISYPFFGEMIEIVVECDGHDHHDITKAQARRDRKRDRDLQALGFMVLRFTGSELYGEPSKCAAEVLDAIMEFQTGVFERAIEKQQGAKA